MSSDPEPQYTVVACTTWIEKMGQRGIFNPQTARNMSRAVEAFDKILADDEDHDIRKLRKDSDELAKRWGRLKQGSPDTIMTYKSRFESGIDNYLAFLSDPVNFKSQVAARPSIGDEKPKKKAAVIPLQASTVPDFERYRLPNGQYIEYRMPSGATKEAIQRFAYHLLTQLDDFDPTRGPVGGDAGTDDGSTPLIASGQN
jgi:hypothetical protein